MSTPEYNNLSTNDSVASLNGLILTASDSTNGKSPGASSSANSNANANGNVNGNLPVRKYSESSIDEEDDRVRIAWGHKIEFVLSIVSYAVGLGNIW